MHERLVEIEEFFPLWLPKGYVSGDKMGLEEVHMRGVELRVNQDGETLLVYVFKAVSEAAEMFVFLRDFFPDASFVVQPVRH